MPESCSTEPFIIVFDVTPVRISACVKLGFAIPDYYTETMSLQFFHDIALVYNGRINLYWKKKRRVGRSFVSPRFENKRDQIIRKYYTPLDDEIAARRIIEKSVAVISMPFTSTAHIADSLGKPSIFYDATNDDNVKTSYNIPVLYNKNELNTWLDRVVENC